jgi:hypothetical protein
MPKSKRSQLDLGLTRVTKCARRASITRLSFFHRVCRTQYVTQTNVPHADEEETRCKVPSLCNFALGTLNARTLASHRDNFCIGPKTKSRRRGNIGEYWFLQSSIAATTAKAAQLNFCV